MFLKIQKWISQDFGQILKNITKINLFNLYLRYELYNVMYTLVIKLNELIAINMRNQLQTLLFEGIK